MSAAERFRARYGPWAVVTGASSGIGRACAVQLAAAGVNVVLAARRRGELTAVADDLTGVEVRIAAVDLAEADGPYRLAEEVRDLDVGLLVAAAGFGTAEPFLETDLDEQLAMLDVNCRAVLVLTRLLAPRLASRDAGGGILLFGSLVGRQGAPGSAHYGATKAWVQALGEGLHVELAPAGVTVLTSTPGPVHSGFADRAGMRMSHAATPDRVAVDALAALRRGRMTTTPGAVAKTLTSSLAGLPRPLRTRIMSRVLRGLTAEPASGHPAR